MCHGNSHYLGFAFQIENFERKPRKNKLACSMVGQWILRRSFDDSGEGIVLRRGRMRSRLVGCARSTTYALPEVRHEPQGEA
jgi:hypothetical protein